MYESVYYILDFGLFNIIFKKCSFIVFNWERKVLLYIVYILYKVNRFNFSFGKKIKQ